MKSLLTCMLALCAGECVALGPVFFPKAVAATSDTMWPPIEEIVADAGIATIALTPQPPAIAMTETRRYVFVRGVWPDESRQSIAKAIPELTAESNQLQDFEMQRQERSEGRRDRDWEAFDLQHVSDLLSRVRQFDTDVIDPAAMNPVITSPLPERIDGKWNDVSHTRLHAATPGSLLLFRCPDFNVAVNTEYRYRVRLKVKAGNESIWTVWSEPTDWVAVPHP